MNILPNARYYNVQQRRWMLPSGHFCPSLCTKMPVPPPPTPPPRRPTPPPAPTPACCKPDSDAPCGLMNTEDLESLLQDEEIYENYLQSSPQSPQLPRTPNFNIESSLFQVSILVIKIYVCMCSHIYSTNQGCYQSVPIFV